VRGRLIFPFEAELAQFDAAGTAANRDGTSPLAEGGFDPIFREPIKLPTSTGQGPGRTARAEHPLIRVDAQIESGTFDKLRAFFGGNSPDSRIAIVVHYRSLEAAGMIDTDGTAKIRIGDRLNAIYDRSGNLVQAITNQLFVVEAQPDSYGIGQSRNLLIVFFESRDMGMAS
jgi:hypothetical protein